MMKLNLRKISALLFCMTLLLVLLAPAVPAVESVAFQLPVNVSAEGTPPAKAEEYTVRMTALEENSPMPDSKRGGSCDLTLKGLGDMSFLPIEYDNVGVHTYRIEQLPGENKNCNYDDSFYTLKVYVVNGADGADGAYRLSVTLCKGENGEKANYAGFINTYKTKTVLKPDGTPKTGTDSNVLVWIIIMLISGFGVIEFAALIKRSKDRENGYKTEHYHR